MFTDKAIYSLLDSTYIGTSINIDDTLYAPLTKKYRVTAVPVMVVLNSSGFMLEREESFTTNNKVKFFTWLSKALANETIVKGISNKLDMGYPSFYDQYFGHMPRVMPTKEQVDGYLHSIDNPFTEIAWDVKSSFSLDPNEMDNLVRVLIR